jgi:hypothetical protein
MFWEIERSVKKFYNGWKNKTLYQLEDGAAGNTGIWIKYTKKYWP